MSPEDSPPTSLRAVCSDLNGQMRGKRMGGDQLPKIEFTGLRMPLSCQNLDLWGEDILGSPLVFASGDADGQLRVTERGSVPAPWLSAGSEILPMWMFTDGGAPFGGDPRHALARVIERFQRLGWKPVAAMELEFTFLDPGSLDPSPAPGCEIASQVLGMEQLDRYAALFDEIFAGAETMGIRAQGAISEGGLGQFEINLEHCAAMRMADDTWLMKQLIRGIAQKHGLIASFMAKPFAEGEGNSMHGHVSLLDREGRNLFDNGLHSGSGVMHRAVAGCLACMPAATLIFAPWENSYLRISPGSHAPTGASWGYENRTTAIRIPGGDPAARRIEHRVPGADGNPYLVLAAILGAMLVGLEDELSPPEPMIGNAYEQRQLHLPTDWDSAITRFSQSPKMARIFSPLLIENLTATKQQEQRRMADLTPKAQLRAMLQAV
ncbi:MAG: glutamine synthetase family protein [Mangrovicoccus sp.]|nr:glutamine synthetase family protein [Mangrovicoccus sp.]